MTIKLAHLSVKKGTTTILEDINLVINDNENWAIIGENGSGKTTLLRVLAGKEFCPTGTYERQTGPKTELLGNNFKDNHLVNKAYQYYQQRYTADGAALAPTVYEVVQNQVKPLNTFNEASVTLSPKPYSDLEIEEWANTLKINHLLTHSIVTLSNGETRRGPKTRRVRRETCGSDCSAKTGDSYCTSGFTSEYRWSTTSFLVREKTQIA